MSTKNAKYLRLEEQTMPDGKKLLRFFFDIGNEECNFAFMLDLPKQTRDGADTGEIAERQEEVAELLRGAMADTLCVGAASQLATTAVGKRVKLRTFQQQGVTNISDVIFDGRSFKECMQRRQERIAFEEQETAIERRVNASAPWFVRTLRSLWALVRGVFGRTQ